MSQPTTKPTQAAPQPASAAAPAKPPRRPPLTVAERQRRHRAKQKQQLEELKKQVSEGVVSRLANENAAIKNELKKAQEIAIEKSFRLKELMESIARREEQERSVRACLKTILYRATPGVRKMFENGFQKAGCIEWLDAD